MLLPPRYRGHEEELVSIYGLTGVRDAGLRAAFRWFKEPLGFQRPASLSLYRSASAARASRTFLVGT